MVHYANVAQGTGDFYNDAANWYGSEGMVTCIGIWVQTTGQGAFVAHIDSGQAVQQPGPIYDYVVQQTQDLMTNALGAYNPAVHTAVGIYSGGMMDLTLNAEVQGVNNWIGTPLQLTKWDGFRVRGNGTGLTWVRQADVGNPVNGTIAMSIPPYQGDAE